MEYAAEAESLDDALLCHEIQVELTRKPKSFRSMLKATAIQKPASKAQRMKREMTRFIERMSAAQERQVEIELRRAKFNAPSIKSIPIAHCALCGDNAAEGMVTALKTEVARQLHTTHALLCFSCSMAQEDYTTNELSILKGELRELKHELLSQGLHGLKERLM